MKAGIVPAMLLVLSIPAAGCSVVDPNNRPGTLALDNAPTVNAASMVAFPPDMAYGRGSSDGDGQQAAAAIGRVRSGTVKPFVQTDSGTTTTSSGSDAGNAAAAAAQ